MHRWLIEGASTLIIMDVCVQWIPETPMSYPKMTPPMPAVMQESTTKAVIRPP
jgi:hypothetical protein